MKQHEDITRTVFLNGTNKWYVEVETEHLGTVLLLDKAYPNLPIPVSFDTEQEAIEYMKEWKKEVAQYRKN